ncbi:MAG: hypothetical protein K6F99_08515 [Lachnospiraceae bacterium]|nr:hypothetical protein [Lachnospiraceae bacterium]
MGKRSIGKNTGKVLFFPIFFAATCSNTLDIISMFLDETIVGNMFEDAAFGAFNAVEPYQLVQTFISYLICIGGVALIVRSGAENDHERVNELFSHSITSSLLLGVLTLVIYTLFATPMGKAVSGGTEIEPYVLQVLNWSKLTVLVEPLYIFLFTYTLIKVGSFYALSVTVIEITTNYALSVILGKTVGIGGIIFATGLSYILGIILLFLFIFVIKKTPIKMKLRFRPEFVRNIVIISFPESSYLLAVVLMESVINYVAIMRYDVMGIAVASVLINVFELVLHISEGVSEYEAAAVNEYLGQKNKERMSECIRITIRAAVLEGVIFSILYFALADALVSIFDINDPATYGYAVQAVRIMAIAPIFICLTRITAIFYQYTKRTFRAAFLIVMSWGLLPAAFGWMLSGLSIYGIIWGTVLGISVTLLIMYLYVRFIAKEKVWEVTPQMYNLSLEK